MNCKQIELTGKETKQDIIQLLVDAKPYFEVHEWHAAHYFKGYKKPDLLKLVKIYNANVYNGGNGNISAYHNPEALQCVEDVNSRIKEAIYTKYGIDYDKEIKLYIDRKTALSLQDQAKSIIPEKYNGFIGPDPTEQENYFNDLMQLFDGVLSLPEDQIKYSYRNADYKGESVEWVFLRYFEDSKEYKSGVALPLYNHSKEDAVKACKRRILREKVKEIA